MSQSKATQGSTAVFAVAGTSIAESANLRPVGRDRCFIEGCPSSAKKHDHVFECPARPPELYKKWKAIIPPNKGRPFDVNRNKICDLHFNEDFIIKTKRVYMNNEIIAEEVRKKWTLKTGAFPTKLLRVRATNANANKPGPRNRKRARIWRQQERSTQADSAEVEILDGNPADGAEDEFQDFASNSAQIEDKSRPLPSASAELESPIFEDFEYPPTSYHQFCISCNSAIQTETVLSTTAMKQQSSNDPYLCKQLLKKQVVQDKSTLLFFLTETLGMREVSFWLPTYGDFPFCQKCELGLRELYNLHQKLELFRMEFEKEKGEFVKKICSSYCLRRAGQSKDESWKEFCRSGLPVEALLEAWQSNSTRGQQKCDTSTQTEPEELEEPEFHEMIDVASPLPNPFPKPKKSSPKKSCLSSVNATTSGSGVVDLNGDGVTSSDITETKVPSSVATFIAETITAASADAAKRKLEEDSEFLSYFTKPDGKKVKLARKRITAPQIPKTCAICNAKTTKMLVHMRTHTGERPFKCHYCPRAFIRRDGLVAHEGSHKSFAIIQYNCAVTDCTKIVTGKRRLIAHLNWHYKHGTGQHLSHHRQEQQPLIYYQCDYGTCTQNFYERESHFLRVHELPADKIPKFPCLNCPKVFSQEQNLETHTLALHNPQPEPDPGDVKFDCTYCIEYFKSEQELETHSKQHQIELSPDGPIWESTDFLCHGCGKTFVTNTSLLSHQYKCSALIGDRGGSGGGEEKNSGGTKPSITCEKCGKGFSNAAHLENHSYEHMDGHPGFPCESCPKLFVKPFQLRQHKRFCTSLASAPDAAAVDPGSGTAAGVNSKTGSAKNHKRNRRRKKTGGTNQK